MPFFEWTSEIVLLLLDCMEESILLAAIDEM
jgi:hypothetical protein